MIKDLSDVVNIITKDSYLNSVLDFESYNCFGYGYKAIYIFPKEERSEKQFVDFKRIEISVLDPRNIKIGVDIDRYVDRYISWEMLSELIDPTALSECVDTIYNYKKFFQVKEHPNQWYSICISGSKFPCITGSYGQEKGVVYDMRVKCSENFSLRHIRFESSSHLSSIEYETECGSL